MTGVLFAALFFLAGCTSQNREISGADFEHELRSAQKPWTGEHFDAADQKFTFAVFSDLTGGERDRVLEIAVAQMNLLRPELIVNVGDLIEGSDDRAEVEAQWDSFEARAGKARAPVFYVGGNHDLLGEALQASWSDRLGPTYYHFVYRDVLFLVLDTDDHGTERTLEIAHLRRQAMEVADTQGWAAYSKTEYANLPENDAGTVSRAQADYMIEAIRANPDVRWTFLLMHKAPWRRPDQPTFTAIEDVLADRPYTLFHGHEHVYAYEQRRGRDYIQLATTGGVQFPERGLSADHLVLVTVDDTGVDIANLLMSGILDKTGKVPLGGDEVCFGQAVCGD